MSFIAMLCYILIFLKPWETTGYERYLKVLKLNYEKIEIADFSFEVPSEWVKNSITQKELTDKMMTYYQQTNSEDFDYSDEIVEYRDDKGYLIFKKDEFYLSLIVIDDITENRMPENQYEVEEFLKSLRVIEQEGYITENAPDIIGAQRPARYYLISQIYKIKDINIPSAEDNGYIKLLRSDNNKLAVLSVSICDNYYSNYPTLDRYIADSLTQIRQGE